MKRRLFLASAAAAAASVPSAPALASGPATAPVTPAAPRHRALMKLGCQRAPIEESRLQFLKRHAVDHICGTPPAPANGRYWTVDELARAKALVEQHGIALDMIPLPFLASSHIDRTPRPAIMLADSPERDRDIEDIHRMIAACAQVGIPAIKYNMSILGVLSTAPVEGRGGSISRAWKLADAKPATPLTRAGTVDAARFWERITYFLDAVVPVAAQHKIRLACHPHDPGVPPAGYQGVDRVLGTVEGLKKFITIRENPYHGLNFCQGTVCEMLQQPAEEIFDIIRYFGTRRKIFNVHFRNIKGRRDDFHETYPDNGDIDFWRALLVYKEVGYDGMMMPDHMPKHKGDPDGFQAFAYAYGYIKALIQAADAV
jgi:mannonate dehydratase